MRRAVVWLVLLGGLPLGCDDGTSGASDALPPSDAAMDAVQPDGTVDALALEAGADWASADGASDGGGDGQPVADAAGPCPAETVEVAAGAFMMGCNAAVDSSCQDDEKPYRSVTLSRFCVDKVPVTQADYKGCVDQGSCTQPADNFDPINRAQEPVVNVSWDQAQAYCAFRGKRLPTEAEWEKAARGTDGRLYPWGNGTPDCTLANYSGCVGSHSVVGSLPAGASPYGALDMAGNVWEWTADWYDATYYGSAPTTDPQGPKSGSNRVLRGGSSGNVAAHMRCSNRSSAYNPAVGGSGVGFRCAR